MVSETTSSRLTVVSHTALSEAKMSATDNNDMTTTCEKFIGTNIVQIWPACNPLVIYAIPMIYTKLIVSLVTTTQTHAIRVCTN